MKNNLIYISASTLLLGSCNLKDSGDAKNSQPNFLFILIDDQPFDAIGMTGRYPFLKTPNMDKLVKEGAYFENYFVTQSICSPSRASFLTGTYPHTHGVNQNHPKIDPDWSKFQSYPAILQENGYQTAFIGKLHMAHYEGQQHVRPGFDFWYSFKGQGVFFDPMINDNGNEVKVEGYMTDILTERAIQWITEERDQSKPFSLCLWHKAVHEPHAPAPRHDDLYKNDTLPYPPYNTHKETFKGKPEWQRIKAWDYKWKEYVHSDELPEKPWGIQHGKYISLLRCLAAVDESLGKVINALKESGELENTVIIYSSDNGYFMGEHTYWDKRILYENSIKIPMIIRYPKMIKPGTDIEELCLNIDLAPTILDLAGIPAPDYMQGESMINLLSKGNNADWRKACLMEYYVDDAYPYAGPDMTGIRTDSFKLVDNYLDDDIDELYNLKTDPGEMKNLINDPEYDKVESRLRKDLEELKIKYQYNPDRDWWLREILNQ